MKKLLPLFAVTVLVLSACGNAAKDELNEEDHLAAEHTKGDTTTTHNHVSGDLQEVTASSKVLPKFLDTQSEDIRLVYEVAGQATEILEWIPCYCGCGESVGHQSNLNCFIAETREDGSIVWDDHGTRCLVCLEIAVESVKMHQDGKSLKEIREAIDTKYQDGFATPTPTKIPV